MGDEMTRPDWSAGLVAMPSRASRTDLSGWIGGNAEGGNGGGEHVVVADEEEQLDDLPLGEVGVEGGPGGVVESVVGEELIDGGEDGLFAGGPGGGAAYDGAEVGGGDADAAGQAGVV